MFHNMATVFHLSLLVMPQKKFDSTNQKDYLYQGSVMHHQYGISVLISLQTSFFRETTGGVTNC